MVRFRAAAGRLKTDRLLLSPNPPLSRQGRLALLGALAIVMGAYSVFWARHGLWLVLPFAGLELAVLAAVLQYTARRGRGFELVAIDGRELRIQRRRMGRCSTQTWRAGWARVRLVPGDKRWHPRRLQVGAYGRWTELGRFLTDAERAQAAEHLRRALAPHSVRQRTI